MNTFVLSVLLWTQIHSIPWPFYQTHSSSSFTFEATTGSAMWNITSNTSSCTTKFVELDGIQHADKVIVTNPELSIPLEAEILSMEIRIHQQHSGRIRSRTSILGVADLKNWNGFDWNDWPSASEPVVLLLLNNGTNNYNEVSSSTQIVESPTRLTPSDLVSTDFGFWVEAKNPLSGTITNITLFCIEVVVTYTLNLNLSVDCNSSSEGCILVFTEPFWIRGDFHLPQNISRVDFYVNDDQPQPLLNISGCLVLDSNDTSLRVIISSSPQESLMVTLASYQCTEGGVFQNQTVDIQSAEVSCKTYNSTILSAASRTQMQVLVNVNPSTENENCQSKDETSADGMLMLIIGISASAATMVLVGVMLACLLRARIKRRQKSQHSVELSLQRMSEISYSRQPSEYKI